MTLNETSHDVADARSFLRRGADLIQTIGATSAAFAALQAAIDALEKDYADLKCKADNLLQTINLLREKAGMPRRPGGWNPTGVTNTTASGAVRMRKNSDQMRVLETIRKTPGLRGIEIVRAIEMAGHIIHERTVRTALSRLTRIGMIEQREGGWYACGVDFDSPH